MKAWEQLGVPLIDAFVQDVRFALRLLARERGFAVTAILVLGLGIGVNNMMFTLIYGITMRGLPIPARDRVLHVSTFDQRFPDRPLTFPEYDHLRRHVRTFEGLAAYFNAPVAVSDEGRAADRFDATYLTANAFTLARTAPSLGRMFSDADDQPGAAPVAILGAIAWRTRYASDPSIVGKAILVDGTPTTVIGIMPGPSQFPTTAEVWLPLARTPGFDVSNQQVRTLRVFGRVSSGAHTADAAAEIETLFANVPVSGPTAERPRVRVVPLNDRFFFSPLQPAWLAFSTAGILIALVCCANAANLMLATTGRRAREIAVRTSLGASRVRVVCQILVESFVVATLGGIVALVVSIAAVRVFDSAIPEGAMPYWMHYSMDSRVLLALVAAALVAVFLVGLVPALHASRTDVTSVLKDGGRSATHRRSRRLSTAFLAAELAIAIVLAMLVVTSWRDAKSVPPSDAAIDTPTVLTSSVTLPSAKYPSSEQRYAFYQRLLERLPALGGVSAASAGSFVPLAGAVEQRLEVESDSRTDLEQAPTVPTVTIDAGYFAVFALPLRLGRDFSCDDGLAGRESAIVNQRFVDVYLADRNPLGRRIRLTPPTATSVPPSWLTIIGVAEDVRPRNGYVEPVVYVPLRTGGAATVSILMRSSLAPADAATLLRTEVMAIDPTLPLYRVMTMTRAVEDAQWNSRVSHRLITGLTLIAVLISIVGLYAVTSHAVTQRMQELGIRMALGACARDVSILILGRAAFQVGLGLLLGLAGTIVWGSVFPDTGRAEPQLLDPAVFAAVCVVLAVVTLGACVIPLRRATALDPATTLREP